MLAAKFTQGSGFEIGEIPMPRIGEDEILIRVEGTSICGTDLKIIRNGHRKLKSGQTIVLGHEFVGNIEKVGSRVKEYSEGIHVGVAPNIGCGHCEMCGCGLMNMCANYSAFGIDRDGSHTEFIRIPASAIAQGNLVPIAHGLSPIKLSLAEPLSCAVNGMRAARVKQGDTVLIYGAGPMGLLNLMMALISGASQVFMVDPNDDRLERAKSLGADKIFNPTNGTVRDWVMDETLGRGVNVVITAAPVSEIQRDAIQLLAQFGRLCLFAGLPPGQNEVGIDTNAIHYKQLTVTGMTGGSPQDYRTAVKLIEAGRVDVMKVVSHVFALSEVSRGYEMALSGKGMKVVLVGEKWLPKMNISDTNAVLKC